MACHKEIGIVVDWTAIVDEVYKLHGKGKLRGQIAMRLMETEQRYIELELRSDRNE